MHNYQPRERGAQGLVCRKCGGRLFCVIYTRYRDGFILRRRECPTCGNRMLTQERPVGEESRPIAP